MAPDSKAKGESDLDRDTAYSRTDGIPATGAAQSHRQIRRGSDQFGWRGLVTARGRQANGVGDRLANCFRDYRKAVWPEMSIVFRGDSSVCD